MFDYVIERAEANANIRLHASFEPLAFAIGCGDETTFMTVDNEGARLSTETPPDGAIFTMTASVDAWHEFRKDEPKPGFQTLSAMRRTQNLLVEGDMVAFFRNLMLLELLFSDLSDAPIANSGNGHTPTIKPVTGRAPPP